MATEMVKSIGLEDHPDPEQRLLQQRGRHRPPVPPPPFWAARPRLLGAVAVAVAVVSASLALLIPIASARQGGESPTTTQPGPSGEAGHNTPANAGSPPARALVARPVKMNFDGFLSWALRDHTGRVSGSGNRAEDTYAGSIIKAWIVSDFLRRSAEAGREPTRAQLTQASRAIRISDDVATDALFLASGGREQIGRMISICGLTDTSLFADRWRGTRISARDAVRLGACVADGRAAGPTWTDWVRDEMANVRGSLAAADQPFGGRWGIIDGLPSDILRAGVGIKNGWLVVEGEWQVNCLAVADDWSLAVLLRYPAKRGLPYGAQACADVAAQLVPPAA